MAEAGAEMPAPQITQEAPAAPTQVSENAGWLKKIANIFKGPGKPKIQEGPIQGETPAQEVELVDPIVKLPEDQYKPAA